MRSAATAAAPVRVAETLERAREHLLSLQDEAGWWKGELQTNVTMDAEDLLLRKFLGILTPEVLTPAAAWIRSQQRADGTWANFHDGPGDLSTTIEAYVALRLAGDTACAEHMSRAREFIVDSGGLEASRVFTRIWLALFGAWSWDDLPALPPELIFCPSWFPFNIYDWACWARQTLVPLTVLKEASRIATAGASTEVLVEVVPGVDNILADRAQILQVFQNLVSCTPTSDIRIASCARWRSVAQPTGSSAVRRPTDRGVASSRLGSTRSWRSTCSAIR